MWIQVFLFIFSVLLEAISFFNSSLWNELFSVPFGSAFPHRPFVDIPPPPTVSPRPLSVFSVAPNRFFRSLHSFTSPFLRHFQMDGSSPNSRRCLPDSVKTNFVFGSYEKSKETSGNRPVPLNQELGLPERHYGWLYTDFSSVLMSEEMKKLEEQEPKGKLIDTEEYVPNFLTRGGMYYEVAFPKHNHQKKRFQSLPNKFIPPQISQGFAFVPQTPQLPRNAYQFSQASGMTFQTVQRAGIGHSVQSPRYAYKMAPFAGKSHQMIWSNGMAHQSFSSQSSISYAQVQINRFFSPSKSPAVQSTLYRSTSPEFLTPEGHWQSVRGLFEGQRPFIPKQENGWGKRRQVHLPKPFYFKRLSLFQANFRCP